MFENMNKTDWKVLKAILAEPHKKFYLRELSKQLNISPSSVHKALLQINQYNLIKEEKQAHLRIIFGNSDEVLFKQLKITLNIMEIKPLIEKLKPAISIIVYGSYATGTNTKQSDIDIFVLATTKKKVSATCNNQELQIIQQTPAQWNTTKKNNPAFAKEIKQGIFLYGESLG